jgi:hypothetical protein
MSTKYPEHERMRAVHDKAQLLGAFLEWLESDGRRVAEYHEHRGEECAHARGEPHGCGKVGEASPYYLQPMYTWEPNGRGDRTERVLAMYLDIDLEKIRDEKELMYQELRATAEGG